MAAAAVSGTIFGAALATAGVYAPPVILDQLRWSNYHMLQVFLTATSVSAVITAIGRRLGYKECNCRQYADRGWFAPYDGNIVGGMCIGAGMAICGACPGTVLAQTALGLRSGYYALVGGLLGGAVWTSTLRPRVLARKAALDRARTKPAPALPTSLQDLLGTSENVALVGLVAFFSSIVAAASLLVGPGPEAKIWPVYGGLFIGISQFFNVAVRQTTLGVSGLYRDVGEWLIYWASSRESKDGKPAAKPAVSTIFFAIGLVFGARALVTVFPYFGVSPTAMAVSASIAPATAILGGFTMVMGAQIAGGCTSGHGISGMALLSVASYITMASTFIGGGIVGLLF